MIGSIVKIILMIIFLPLIIAVNAAAEDFPTILKKLNNIHKQLDNINNTKNHDIAKPQTPTPAPQPVSNAPADNNNSNQLVLLDSNINLSETLPSSKDELLAELQELSYQLRLIVNQPEKHPEPAVNQVDQETHDAEKFIAELQQLTHQLQAIANESKK